METTGITQETKKAEEQS